MATHMHKPYRARSLSGANQKVRLLQTQIEERDRLIERWAKELALLAKLAADGPAFFNPLEAAEAEKIRDQLLKKLGMNPDGTFR